jgi:plasmid stability protein
MRNHTMPSLTIKNLPEQLLEGLREEAAMNRRSLNQEVIARLENSVARPAARDARALLERIRALRGRIQSPVDDALLRRARREGRP